MTESTSRAKEFITCITSSRQTSFLRTLEPPPNGAAHSHAINDEPQLCSASPCKRCKRSRTNVPGWRSSRRKLLRCTWMETLHQSIYGARYVKFHLRGHVEGSHLDQAGRLGPEWPNVRVPSCGFQLCVGFGREFRWLGLGIARVSWCAPLRLWLSERKTILKAVSLLCS
jgi:hypothetical protein